MRLEVVRLPAEEPRHFVRDLSLHLLAVHRIPGQHPHGRHPAAAQTAGDDPRKGREVGVQVQREAVGAHPVAEVHPDGRDLLRSDPDAGRSRRAPGLDPVPRQHADQHLLDLPEVAVHVLVERPQVEDPVADELPRPVPGDIAAAVDLHHLHAAGPEPLGVQKQVLPARVLPQRHDRLVLEEQQRVGDPPACRAAQRRRCSSQASR